MTSRRDYTEPAVSVYEVVPQEMVCQSTADDTHGINPPSFDDLGDFDWGLPVGLPF